MGDVEGNAALPLLWLYERRLTPGRVRRLPSDLALKTPIWSAASSILLLVILFLVGVLARAAQEAQADQPQGNRCGGEELRLLLGKILDVTAQSLPESSSAAMPPPSQFALRLGRCTAIVRQDCSRAAGRQQH